jgi:hypothetical protein
MLPSVECSSARRIVGKPTRSCKTRVFARRAAPAPCCWRAQLAHLPTFVTNFSTRADPMAAGFSPVPDADP